MSHESETALPAPARAALGAFAEAFGAMPVDGPRIVAWAPGRVNLIGEHTDYNDGWVLPVAINRVVALAGRRLAPAEAQLVSAHHRGYVRFPLPQDGVVRERRGHHRGLPLWGRFVRAVAAEYSALSGSGALAGFAAAIVGDVPVGGGMSSSAALEVAAATLMTALGAAPLSPMEMAQLCQRAEQQAAGVRVGIMDQATACLGRPETAILLDCRTLQHTYIPAALPGATLLVYSTGVPHSLAATAYNERRAQCEEATELLAAALRAGGSRRSVTALRDITLDDLACCGAELPDLLLRRARHVVTENERVKRAADAVRQEDLPGLGRLLDASHASLRDDYAVSSAELDAVVEIARSAPGVYGARMMGAGFGGSALILVEEAHVEAVIRALAEEYPRRSGRVGQPHICRISGGAQWREIRDDSA